MKWTEDEIRWAALKYNNRSAFNKNLHGCVQAAKRLGIYDEVCLHMDKKNYSDAMKAARKYESRWEFQKSDRNNYRKLIRNDLLDEACSHMINSRSNWSTESVMSLASNYSSMVEFIRENNSAYDFARRNGIWVEASSHMIRKKGDADTVYIWNVIGTDIYKIGVTSCRLGDLRIKEVARASGFENYEIIEKVSVGKGNAFMIEKEILNLGREADVGSFNGSSEFRFFKNDELALAISILNKEVS